MAVRAIKPETGRKGITVDQRNHRGVVGQSGQRIRQRCPVNRQPFGGQIGADRGLCGHGDPPVQVCSSSKPSLQQRDEDGVTLA